MSKTVPIRPLTRSDVAVVVPCYNVGRFLNRALDSVYAQSFQDFRIYAVDDGSSDNTAEVLKEHSRRCVSIFQTHAGQAAARNHGIRASDSPFIAFLDADDEWLPQKLERQVNILKRNPDLGMVCSLCSLREGGDSKIAQLAAKDMPSTGRLFQHLVRTCFVFTPTVVVRRECIDEVGLFNESLTVSEDFNLWLRIAARRTIGIAPEVLAVTHKRPGSLSVSSAPEERLRNGVTALEDVQSSCPDLTPQEQQALRIALAERFYFYGSHLLSTGSIKLSREKLTSALKLRPSHWRALAKLGLTFLPAPISSLLADLKRTLLFRSHPQDS